ncbi:hypothetical protein [Tatumella ptyseos]|uniref:hypothetical protein n=1 Tax=Tatumella ptyseos TaxID=82987 RepID=UPI0026EBF044|nr:hypothetical protein [Tatumella ptyseos]WKX25408.1 hypothetical protein QJR74_08655 [Tatumella ptyseos]
MKVKGIPYSEVKAKAFSNKAVWQAYQRERRSDNLKAIATVTGVIVAVALIKYLRTH